MKTKILIILQNIFFVASIILCVFILAQKFVFKEEGIFGYRTFVIITSSMQPNLEIGDVIVVKTVDTKTLEAGDIITYQGKVSDFKGKIVTHMIKTIDKDDDGSLLFYTKGTVSNMMDPVVSSDQIYGKMIYRFYLISLVSKIIRSKYGFVLLIFVPLIVILIKQLINIKEESFKEKYGISEEDFIKYKKSHKFKLFKKKSKLDNKIVEVKETPDNLEKTIYSSSFKQEIQNELEKTIINKDLKIQIEKKLEEENDGKIPLPSRGLENTIIDDNLSKELSIIQEKTHDIIIIED